MAHREEFLKGEVHRLVPAPPESIRVPSMSKSTSFISLHRTDLLYYYKGSVDFAGTQVIPFFGNNWGQGY